MRLRIIFIMIVLALPCRIWLRTPPAVAQDRSSDDEGSEDHDTAEAGAGEEEEAAEVAIGERLFLETRFAQYFFEHAPDVNALLEEGDPVLETTATTGDPLAGPFAGQSMSCRACHLVDEHHFTPHGGNRTYADFARRSPVTDRSDGVHTAARNTPALVGATAVSRRRLLLHFDGEFGTAKALVKATLTGRNFGWLPGEHATAVAHIARVVREDDGRGALARAFGGSYRRVLRGGPAVPDELRLPRRFRLHVDRATDEQILDAVAGLVGQYLRSLEFAREEDEFDGTPFDLFLERNGLPRQPRRGQSDGAYARALLRTLNSRPDVLLVRADGPREFALHDQPFRFGQREFAGLQIFLREPRRGETRTSGVGNCIACHAPPTFTDLKAHNTGITQREYDAVHGDGSFMVLPVPTLAARMADPDRFLPAAPERPFALEPFRRPATGSEPGHTDLGLWNIYQNPDLAARRLQRRLERVVCQSVPRARCRELRPDPAAMLDASIALFKTPGLRDLGHSGPYMHNGSLDTLEDVLFFYIDAAELARAGNLRNAAHELADIRLAPEDVPPLAAFLRALNEDYE